MALQGPSPNTRLIDGIATPGSNRRRQGDPTPFSRLRGVPAGQTAYSSCLHGLGGTSEQPAGGAWGADSGVGAAVAGEGCDELGERFGDVQVVGSESEEELRALSFDLVVGDRHDPGQVLAVEQQ